VIQRRGPAQDLRATIDRLPLDVRQAVLDGIQSQRIIAGAHADGGGGVCPMVAAEVSVAWKDVSRSNVAVAQEAARAWDRYADVNGSSRTATRRQLLALSAMLEASILQEQSETQMPLCDAITEFERARARGYSEAPIARAYSEAPIARGYSEAPIARAPLPALPALPAAPAGSTRYLGLADAYEVPAEGRAPIEAPVSSPRRIVVPVESSIPVDLPEAAPSVPDMPQAAPSVPEAPAAARRVPEAPAARPVSRPRRETGERDRSAELREREGWAWLRPFRSYDEYEETLLRALAEIDDHERQLEMLQSR
jgi:hypothetical protein